MEGAENYGHRQVEPCVSRADMDDLRKVRHPLSISILQRTGEEKALDVI